MVKLSDRQGIERTRKSVKAHSRGHLPVMFAVLETDHPPVDEVIILVQDSDAEPSNKFEFRSLATFEDRNAVLGIIIPKTQSSAMRHSRIQVKRGRLGSKPSETLLVLNRLPVQFNDAPGPVLRGILKSVGRALEAVQHEGRAQNLHWWLAIELAMKGYIRRTSVESVAEELGCRMPSFNGAVKSADGLFIWQEYLDRTVDQLEDALTAEKNANPFRDSLQSCTICNLLDIRDQGLCSVIIDDFANRHGCPLRADVQAVSCELPDEFRTEASDEDRAVAESILASFAAGEGSSRHVLEKEYPSHRHVIARLFDSGKLVASPEGYVFTRKQLMDYRDMLIAAGEDLSRLSVRVVKDTTGLNRKGAESLQTLFAEMFRYGYIQPLQEQGA